MNKILFLLMYIIVCMNISAQESSRCVINTKYGRCTNDASNNKPYCILHKDSVDTIAIITESSGSVPVERNQCRAITRNGTRCLRLASQGGNYCWQHVNSTTTAKQSPVRSVLTGSRCRARTKKGTQCSRSARSNGLCWQHGG